MLSRLGLLIINVPILTAVVHSDRSGTGQMDQGSVRFAEVTDQGVVHPHRSHVRNAGDAFIQTDRSTLNEKKAAAEQPEAGSTSGPKKAIAVAPDFKIVATKADPEEQKEPKHARIVITEVKPDEEDTTFSQISVFAATNSTVATDISCRAYMENEKPKKKPKADASFLGCPPSLCNRGQGTNCTKDGCVISIGNLHMDRRYFVWCLPEYQPLLPIYWPENIDIFPQTDEGINVQTQAKNPRELHAVVGVENLFAAFLVALYIWWSVEMENRCNFHASGFVVVVGVLAGGFVHYFLGKDFDFSYNMFSYFLLPMVIFSAGFQVRFSDMARSWKLIVLLGVLGTVLTFLVLYQFSGIVWTHFTQRGRLVMASALCATDTVASLAFLPQAIFPMAHVVVFGEGILNDIVSVLLSTSIGKSHPGNAVEFVPVLVDGSVCLLTSLLFGVLFGCAVIFLFQGWTSHLADKGSNAYDDEHPLPISALAMMLLLSYMSYVCAELFDASSILALFTCSVVAGHYSATRLPSSVHNFSLDITKTVGTMADALVYGYFGLTAWSALNGGYIVENAWLIVSLSAVMLAVRVLTIFMFSTSLKFLHGTEMGNRDLLLTSMGGITRGSIAYALILRNVPPPSFRTVADEQLVSMALGLVILNATLMSVLFPMLANRITKSEALWVNDGED